MKRKKGHYPGIGILTLGIGIWISACLNLPGKLDTDTKKWQVESGAIIRANPYHRKMSFVFTGDRYGEGGEVIRRTLAAHNVPAAFFLTGNFYRTPEFKYLIEGLIQDGHYLGAHSDRHLLYCAWEKRDSLLVSREEFLTDLQNNYSVMSHFGVRKKDAPYYLPPFEWYNLQISAWTYEFGVHLINYTPGTRSHADYTTPDMGRRYVSTDSILHSIKHFEQSTEHGLNGFILLMHIGTHPDRLDKLYNRLEELIVYLKSRDLHIVRIDELLPVQNF